MITAMTIKQQAMYDEIGRKLKTGTELISQERAEAQMEHKAYDVKYCLGGKVKAKKRVRLK